MARNFTDWMSALMHYGIPGMRRGVRRIRKVMGGESEQHLPQQYLNRQAQMAAREKAVIAEKNRTEQQLNTREKEEEEKRRRQRSMNRKAPGFPR